LKRIPRQSRIVMSSGTQIPGIAFEQVLNPGKEAISPYVTNFTDKPGSTRDRTVAFVRRLTLCG
jgi:hypothetical protein